MIKLYGCQNFLNFIDFFIVLNQVLSFDFKNLK